MNRSSQREWVFKLIFENQTKTVDDIKKTFENHGLELGEDSFLYQSLKTYIENYEKNKDFIYEEVGLSSINRLSKADRSILFLSVNEIFNLKIPISVSINEAVNLSKEYSTSDGYKFINSVLGRITKKRL